MDKLPKMTHKEIEPLYSMKVNGKYIIAIYQGKLSQFDILIKYRQLENGKWSRVRTPKHIHWTVDLIIKLYQDEQTTKEFLEYLITLWNKTQRITTILELNSIDLEELYKNLESDIKQFRILDSKGEYSVGFLILLAKLLMIQEKTNREDAFMFKNILEKLKNGNKELFGLISTATHNGR